MEQNQFTNCCSKGGKRKRLWKKVKYQLVEYHSLPGYLKDNEYIVGYYRSEWPLKQALLSIFTIHNETFNVWTHLIGFFLFLSLTIYTAMKIQSLQSPQVLLKSDFKSLQDCIPSWKTTFNHTHVCVLRGMENVADYIAPLMVRPITRWPFFMFLCGAMFCLLASSACHLVSCHSEKMSYIMLRVDYTGIAALIATSFFPTVYYSFMCDPFFCNLYLGFITLMGIATVLFSLLPVFQTPKFRTTRALLFSCMGMSGVLPILHKQIVFWHQPEVFHTTGCEILMGVLYGIGALVYATRVPERWMPGKFDIAGHSHQLFHVFVVAGAYAHYRAGLAYLKWRDVEGC